MISLIITLLILIGFLLVGIIYLAIKYGSKKQKLVAAKVQKQASDNALKIVRNVRNKSSDFIRGKLSKHWKK